MLKIQVLTLIAALSVASISQANELNNEQPDTEVQAVTDGTTVAPVITTTPCLSDSKGVPLVSIENNTTLMDVLKPLGGLKGLFHTWDTDGGSVKFYSSPGKRLRLDYEFFGTNIAVITKVCKTEKNILKLSGHNSGDPFVMYIGVTSSKNLIKMSLEGKRNGQWYDFSR